MIPYETVLSQMEQAVMQAKQAQTEQAMRERLAAVRALCDVVLQEKRVDKPMLSQTASFTPPAPTMPKLQESDANGDSIFDF